VLDLMLPKRSGLECCASCARGERVRCCADRDAATRGDKVLGLELGADDYVTKPFGCASCSRACKALLRRARAAAAAATVVPRRGRDVDLAGFAVARGE
jgi:DNA-binding response OmpR family regulator